MFKADAALDAMSAGKAKAAAAANASSNPSAGGGTEEAAEEGRLAPSLKKPQQSQQMSEDRERVQAKLDFATGLSHLGQGNYEKAATSFLRLGGSQEGLGDWLGKVSRATILTNH